MNVFVAIIIIIALILSIRVTLNIVYRDSVTIFLKILFIKIQLLPAKEKKYNPQKLNKQQKKKKEKQEPVLKDKNVTEKPKASITENIKLVSQVLAVFFKKFSKHLHIKLAKIHIKVATGDAAQTAILYGAVSGAAACLIELLDSITNLSSLKRSSISIVPDYLSEKSDVDVNISLSISTFGVLSTLFKSLWKLIMIKFIKK